METGRRRVDSVKALCHVSPLPVDSPDGGVLAPPVGFSRREDAGRDAGREPPPRVVKNPERCRSSCRTVLRRSSSASAALRDRSFSLAAAAAARCSARSSEVSGRPSRYVFCSCFSGGDPGALPSPPSSAAVAVEQSSERPFILSTSSSSSPHMLCASFAFTFSVGVRPNVVLRQRTGLGVWVGCGLSLASAAAFRCSSRAAAWIRFSFCRSIASRHDAPLILPDLMASSSASSSSSKVAQRAELCRASPFCCRYEGSASLHWLMVAVEPPSSRDGSPISISSSVTLCTLSSLSSISFCARLGGGAARLGGRL